MTLAEALNTTLSPDKVKDMSTEELFKTLLDNEIFASEADIRMFIIEGVQKVLVDDDEFPIKIYTKASEEVPLEHKYIDPGPCLTDDYISDNLK